MSWTLARHCKVPVDKTLRCRGRVFLYLHNTGTLYELWQFYYILVHTESQLLYMDNSYKLLVHSSDIICPVLGKCRLSIYPIGPILCKYYANTDRSSQLKRYLIELIVILVHTLQRWPNIIPPWFQCLMFSGA